MAIGVVLAAVMYVLIVGVTHGPNSAPLGTNFAWGAPVNATPASASTSGCGAVGTPNAFCYTIEIAGASVSTSNVILALRNSVGAAVPWPVAVAAGSASTPTTSQITLVSPTASAPVAGYSTSSASWTNSGSFAGSISGGYLIVIYLVGSSSLDAGLSGHALVAVGASGYSGSVPSDLFP